MNTNFSLGTFLKNYGTNDKCLEAIKNLRYPNGIYCNECKTITKFYKITGRQVYQDSLNHQISPLAGTIFEKSSTPLQYWFYAIFLMSVTRSGTSAKQLQRELGVTYKTAWRMFHQIRKLMARSGGGFLEGDVEVDETYIGGKGYNRATKPNFNMIPKEIVMGLVERGGKAYLKHIPDTSKWTLINQIEMNVSPNARILSDELPVYMSLPHYGYRHEAVKHSALEYVRGDVHTQNVENIWSQLKRGIYGVYRFVSKKHLQAYVDEYNWRYNNRLVPKSMFDLLLAQVGEVKAIKPV